MKTFKGVSMPIKIVVGLFLAILISSIIFAGVASGLESQASAASCAGWLGPIASTLADITGRSIC